MRDILKNVIKSVSNVHRPGSARDVLLFATPRGGSTWLAELLASQPGAKLYNEPFDLRKPIIRGQLGIDDWASLYAPEADTKIVRYLRAIHDGRLHYGDPDPFRRGSHRFRTERIVFKVIHGCEDRIDRISDAHDAHVVVLLRHPIAVSLSREVLPRLEVLLELGWDEGLVKHDHALIAEVAAAGNSLQRGVLDWCLQTALSLRDRRPDWTVVTYEQLVVEPAPALQHLARVLDLPAPERMMQKLSEASAVRYKSDAETRDLLERSEMRERLVTKWKSKVHEDEERSLMRILDAFGLRAYRAGDPFPEKSLWIRS